MRGDLNDRVMNRLSCEWASIPPDACNYSQGGGHPNSTIEEFKSKFAANNGRPLPSGPNQFDSIASTAAAVSPSSGGSIGGAQRRNCPEWDRTMSQGKILTGCNMAGALGLGGSTSIAPGASQGVPGAAASTDLVNVPIDVANLQGKLLWPIRNSSGGKLGVKTSDYTANRRGRPHCGVDLASPPPGGYIVAAAPGTVVYAGPQTGRYQGVGFTGYGNVVLIEHDRPTGKIWTLYAHLASVGTSAGAEVQAGTGIGREGNTGVGTGIHLHFEVRLRVSGQWGGVTNPWPLLDLNK
jgi:murein DD-endopeptidase MepM/ murein hydrolase activator NlpD